MDFKGGYILFDCDGLELNDSTEQDINGIYDRAKEALESGKPIYAVNCNMSDAKCSPCSVIAWQEADDEIVATGHVLRVSIKDDDGVTVTNLIAG